MKHVSLLPPEIKSKRMAQRTRSRVYLLLVIIIIMIICINLYLLVNIFFIRQNLKTLQNERTAIDNQVAALTEYEELYLRLDRTKILVDVAMGTVPRWGVLLRDISQTLPVGTQLSEMSINYADQSGTLTLRGWVGDHSSLADLLDRLNNVEQLDQIQVRTSTEIGIEGRETVQFLVESVLLSGPVFLSEDEGGE